jgi:large subunit ribosomal protein L25
MLNHLITHVTIRSIPALIPDAIEVPVGHLEAGGTIFARELVMPPGVELVTPGDTRVAVVVIAKVEVEAPPAAPAEAEPAPGTPPPA